MTALVESNQTQIGEIFKMKLKLKTKAFYAHCFLALTLVACASGPGVTPGAPALNQPATLPGLSATDITPPSQATHRVEFKVNLEKKAFQIASGCSCTAKYAKLTIMGPGHLDNPIYDVNADARGFVPIDPNNETVDLSAIVPVGSNWSARAALFASNEEGQLPVMEVGGAFHNPTTAQVELSLRARQTAQIVEALHRTGSNRVMTALELEKIQEFADALVGVTWNEDGTYELGRFPGLLEGRADVLDADAIVAMIEQGQLDFSESTGAQLGEAHAEQMILEPKVVATVHARPFTGGFYKPVLNPYLNLLFAHDITQSNRLLYRASLPLLTNGGQSNETWGDVRSLYPPLGWYNPTGTQPIPVIYAYEFIKIDQLEFMALKAYDQQTGALRFTQTFGQKDSAIVSFTPLVWRDTQNTPDVNDDIDIVYTFLGRPDTHGIHAVHNGGDTDKDWFVSLAGEATVIGGALSKDGQRLYVLTQSTHNSKLIAINTTLGSQDGPSIAWKTDLNSWIYPVSTPVIGTDGTIYVQTKAADESQNGKMHAIAPDGSSKWTAPLPTAAEYPPIIDHRDGADFIYTSSALGRLYSFTQSGQLRWDFPLPSTVGSGATGGLVIGEDLGGGRTLYAPIGNGLIYAVRDGNEKPELLWAKSPEARTRRGILLKDGILYGASRDGGEGQLNQLKAMRVHSKNMPQAAPWPTEGGNWLGRGVSHQVFHNQNF